MKKNTFRGQPITERNTIQWLLAPFSWLYGQLMELRNFGYDRQLLKSFPTPQFSVVVGNLTVGGTGKTPLVEYLVRELSNTNQIVALSRGYGRHSRGFVLASPDSTAEEIGDEPLQYYEKFGGKIKVAVCEDRVKGSEMLHERFPHHELLVLDDAYQHRALRADRYLLLNDFQRPFYQDYPFPGGRLRENRGGAARADAVITTKCPTNLGAVRRAEIQEEILRYCHPATPCFFSSVRYGTLRNFENTEVSARSVTLVAGIARPEAFIEQVRSQFTLEDVSLFPDHHSYTADEVQELLNNAKNADLILTTEKDKVKLRPLAEKAGALRRFGYIPIEIDFGRDTDVFRTWLRQNVEVPLHDRSAST
ncbi:tetraacyldisaccharide 4'-kinase [Salmonirosea aquatica]|uniref:Tetraacyldisaccharide 4'-kinase n=1 Tax=Salmonirosea aquatica TaxID=2654236 RepID=A0A7C9BLX3_9BACT|nr:tetraacyldisaccharide 4'-kinase [Cytophagaceae bacterium SJW1-29]